jgi:hypothetical protein
MRGVGFHTVGFAVLVLLAGCGRSIVEMAEREPWRADAEAQCMQSGAVRETAGIVRIAPIEGPGACGAEYPLKVAAFGPDRAIGYTEALRPPAGIPNTGSVPPGWGGPTPPYPTRQIYAPPSPPQSVYSPPPQQTYAPPPQQHTYAPPSSGQPMSIQAPGVASAPRSDEPPPRYQAPRYEPPRYEPRDASARGYDLPIERPQTVTPRYAPRADDIPDDAVLPKRQQQTYAPPRDPRSYDNDELPKLGPAGGPAVTGAVKTALSPPATLACPMVSALDKWIAEAVQPAAMRWFRQPVVEIKQISAYSCRGMVGNSRPHISEHAFGNALDVAAFVLADGRKVTVQHGWNGKPEESAFLHDVQMAACDRFTTVLSPGYNVYHYNHLHLDLIRRRSGRSACRPKAISGEVAYARQLQKSKYAHRGGDRMTTGSIGKTGDRTGQQIEAVPGEDGFIEGDGDELEVTGSIGKNPAAPKYAMPSRVRGTDD